MSDFVQGTELASEAQLLNAAVDAMPCGFSLWSKQFKLVLFNERYLELYNLPAEKIRRGMDLREVNSISVGVGNHSHFDVDLINTNYMTSFLDQRERGEPLMFDRVLARRTVRVHVVYRQGLGWLVTHEDVSEEKRRQQAQKEREEELRLQSMRFRSAVSNLSQGLAMFDADRRLVICNEPYISLYELPPELSKPGARFLDIMSYRTRIGMVPAEGEKWLNARIEKLIEGRESDRNVCEMQNGRFISIVHTAMDDGGWLSTHEDITERHLSAARIQHLARHDVLTDLPNRAYFAEEMARAELRMKRGEKMALLCLDLDNFKEINDALGHGVGDEVLRQVAHRLNFARREHEMVARMGGDEFMLLAGPIVHAKSVTVLAQRILDEVSKPMQIGGHQILVNTSIGIAVSPADGSDGASLMKSADLALYRAKKDGRGGFQFFKKGMDADVRRRQMLEADLRKAMENNEFSLCFQPALELESNRISSCEALIVWNHPRLGKMWTGDFEKVAQEIGIYDQLKEWVIRSACEVAAGWPEQVKLSLNMKNLRLGQSRLVNTIAQALASSGLAPARLEVGVSENSLIRNTTKTVKKLRKLQALGVRVCVNEFGKESSSLNHLRVYPFDKINLDSSFVAGISGNQENREIARAVLGLGRSLGIVMAAHGVSDEDQLDFLRQEGCNEVQGSLFSVALPSSQIGELLRTVESRAASEAGVIVPARPAAQA